MPPGPPSWICEPCREQRHAECVGRAHCYCQHRPPTGGPSRRPDLPGSDAARAHGRRGTRGGGRHGQRYERGATADGARARVLTEHPLPASGQVLVVYAGGNDGGMRWALRPDGPAPVALVGEPVAARFVAHARVHGRAFVALGALPAPGEPPAVTLRVRRRLGPSRQVSVTPAVVAGLLWVVEHAGDVVEVEVVAEGVRETRQL